MKKLNNKGITTIEVLLCFIIVVVITVSMHSTISYYSQRRILESHKQKIINYKNLLTQDIQNDLIRIGVTSAKVTKDIIVEESKARYVLDMDLRDSSKRRLIVEQTFAESTYHPKGSTTSDDTFRVEYGDPTPTVDNGVTYYYGMISYDIPKLGDFKNDYGHTVQDLSINNVLIEVVDSRVLTIYIGLYHPELGTRYAINIVSPIDFVFVN